MPILTDSQKALLAAELATPAYAGLSPDQTAAALNAPTSIKNPQAQGQVPKPFTYLDVLGRLGAASVAAVRQCPALPRVLDDINAQNRIAVHTWADFLAAAPQGATGMITPAEHDAIVALLAATVPDPAWPPTVAGPSWVQAHLAGEVFTLPDGSSCSGQVNAAIIAEALS
jgi:hypothetical protein